MPIPLRADFDASRLRAAARESKDAGQTRRLLTLAAIYDGATRTEAAEIGGVTLQIIRDWVLRLNARGPEGLIDRKAHGAKPRLNASHRAALVAAVDDRPIPAVHGVVRWRIEQSDCRRHHDGRCRRNRGSGRGPRPAAQPRYRAQSAATLSGVPGFGRSVHQDLLCAGSGRVQRGYREDSARVARSLGT